LPELRADFPSADWHSFSIRELEVQVKYFPNFLVLSVSLLLPYHSDAGPLYGTVQIDSGGPASAVEISVACPGFDQPTQAPPPAVTDAQGSYSLLVPATGRCQMRVRRGNQVGSAFEMFLSENPLRLDFVVDSAMNRVR
jgi:hypothetical protein